ncbi:MAG: flagellar biosynthesis protein FlhB [Acutalibacter sp.]|jgi:flagellar biosynthetic protein FlhB
MADSSKTEKATPKRRRDERKKGNVFLSQDLVAVASLLGSFATLWLLSGTFVDRMAQFMEFAITSGAQPLGDIGTFSGRAFLEGLWAFLVTVGPVAGVTILCAVGATFGQTRFLVSGEALKPKLNRISPLQGFKRLFSVRSLVEALKGLLKIAFLMVIIYLALENMFVESSRYLYADVETAAAHVGQVAMNMIWQIIVVFIVLAGADFFYQWRSYERQLRMSKEEVKEEYKQTEGDPKVKGRIRDIQRQMARSRMMQAVPQADVVIRNPTHVAVALRYKPESDAAPVVLAMGLDHIALKIVETAQEHNIAVIENVPLARALYAQSKLNQEIPPDLYGPVAEVLVYIFRLNGKKQIVKG